MAPKKSLVSKSPLMKDANVNELSQPQTENSGNGKEPGYVVELAKSGRAMCKKCGDAIGLRTIRIGVVLEGEWGLFTSWQHLECTIFHNSCDSVEKIEGFNTMKESDQAEILKRWEESKNEVDDDMTDINPDDIVRSAWNFPAEPSSDLLMPLLPYQKEGLGWMLSQEGIKVIEADEAGHVPRQITFGGILADEMGMGKTIQAISLMLTNRPSLKNPETLQRWDQSDVSHEFKGSSNDRGGTLLVLPTVAIRQWQTEISRFTREGSLTVKVYHGSDRSTAIDDLLKYDVVITSYKVLEMEYRKETAGIKVECRICGKRFYPEKLRIHRKYFCGETAQRTEAQSKTEKKRIRSGATTSRNEDSDSGGDEDDEDEISKQKKANKSAFSSKNEKVVASGSKDELLNQKKRSKNISDNNASSKSDMTSVKGSANKSTVKASKKSVTASSANISDHSTSSEDEIARQKLENRKRIAEKPLSKQMSKVASKAKKIAIEDLSTSSEDEIARQKLENKRRETKEADNEKTPSGSSRKRSVSTTVSKTTALSSSAKKRIRRNDDTVDHVKEDSDVYTTPKKNLSQMLSFDSSDESARNNHRTAITSASKKNTPRKSKTAQVESDQQVISKEEFTLVQDIFKSPYRRPQRAAAIASAQKNTILLSGSKHQDDEEEEEEEELVSDAVVSESDISGKSSDEGMDLSDDENQVKFTRKQKVVPVVNTSKSNSTEKTKISSKGITASKSGKSTPKSTDKRKKIEEKDDDEYFYNEEDEESNDDESLIEEKSEEVDDEDISNSPKKGKSINGKKKTRTGSNSKLHQVDEEVENDIREAIKAHLKASKNATAVKSLLHRISWFRIILDEAHMIKDRSTSTCKAVFNLVSLNKWCLTGTPLQNRVGELYSLIRFLRIDPHAYYFCRNKGCECKSLHYRFTNSRCDDCEHSVIQHFCHFNRNILNPIQRCGFVNEGRRAMMKLKHQILDHILLRRTKTTRADDIQLPMRIVQVRQERMDEKEEDFYQALYTQSQAQFNTYLMAGTVLNNYAHIFDILIRLRQAVDHPYLVIYSDSQGNNTAVTAAVAAADEANQSRKAALLQATVCEDDSNNLVCGLCQDPVEDAVTTACKHVFCRACIMDFVSTVSSSTSTNGGNLCCPDCNKLLTLQLGNNDNTAESSTNNMQNSIWNESKRRRKSILDKIDLRNFQTSTKMEALMEELYRMGEEDVGSKAIVFSQFVNMLDLLEYRIQVGGIGCVKLSGSMTVEQRDKIITAFKEDSSIRVLLISLKAGGVALNLTVASRIFLMDPWWNPAAEMQAIDRTHRIGQYKPIFATRFIIEDSIEERILKLQEKKKLVFDGTVGGDAGSMTKLTVDDMRFLFQ